jgi:K+-sensing histidine kinase KdpD
VTSTGPKIEDGELEQIFVTAVRGKNAIRSGKAGSGLGLPVLNRIVKNVFGGSIEVSQKNTYLQIGSIPYSEISFEIKLPISRHS